ncbi:MAG: MFS transporter [Gammaproteobacteria bacterium]|nr:MFS transporter [Gammaproteobacteria bacterium]
MQNFLNKGLIPIDNEAYLSLLIIIAPLLNFLSGINIDLYTPSLPSISLYYGVSISAVKNTITASMMGFALGSIIFGTIVDLYGRRRILLLGTAAYTIASFLILLCTNIDQFIMLRFIQGIMVASVSIAPRALIMDNFAGHRYNTGILYTSIAYGLGPIIGPFIGGILEYHFGWKSNFWAYGITAFCLFLVVMLYINESLSDPKKFSTKTTLNNYSSVLKHPIFIAGALIGSATQLQFMVYPTLGSFIVENIMHRSAITYGNSALLIACGYLLGTLTNRLLIKRLHLKHITFIGFMLLCLGSIVQIGFALFSPLNLFTLILPIGIIGFSNGFIFPNVFGTCLRLFPKNAGIAIAVFTCVLMAIAGFGVFIISHIDVTSLRSLAGIFGVTIVIQLLVFFGYFKHKVSYN